MENTTVRGAALPAASRSANRARLKKTILCGLMGGLSAVLMLLKVPLPFMPPFMSFDFSGIVEIIGGFAMGPGAAVGIITVKILVKSILQGTGSVWTGELQNFILSCAYVLPAVLIYYRRKTKATAKLGMAVGTVLCAIVAVFTNLFIIIPFYVTVAHLPADAMIAMCTAVNPFITSELGLALWGIIPFNLIKNGVLSLLTFVMYKRLSVHMKHFIGD